MRSIALICLLLTTALRAEPLPVLAGKDLTGADLALPQAFGGKAGVIVAGLSKQSSKACQAWEDRLWSRLASAGDPVTVTLVELEGAPGFIVPFIVKGIKKAKESRRFSRILILRQGREALSKAAGYDPGAKDDAYVLLVDPAGAIRWRAHDGDLSHWDALLAAWAGLKAVR